MKKIYKYRLLLMDTQVIVLPFGATMLSVQYQDGLLCLWAIVDLDNEIVEHQINIYGTGEEMSAYNDQYIGTVQDGNLVWHIFHLP